MDGWTRHGVGIPEAAKELDHFVYIYIIRTPSLYSVVADVLPARVSKPISFELTESLEGTKLWIFLREYGLRRKRRRRRCVFATLIKDLTWGYNGGFAKGIFQSRVYLPYKAGARQLSNVCASASCRAINSRAPWNYFLSLYIWENKIKPRRKRTTLIPRENRGKTTNIKLKCRRRANSLTCQKILFIFCQSKRKALVFFMRKLHKIKRSWNVFT